MPKSNDRTNNSAKDDSTFDPPKLDASGMPVYDDIIELDALDAAMTRRLKAQLNIAGCPSQLVRIAKLETDHGLYQRDLKDAQVKRIRKTYRNELLRTIIVARRDAGKATERMLIVDGQHSAEAAKQEGHEYVYAVIIDVDNQEEEAWLFEQYNTMGKRLNAQDIYKARLGWKHPVVTAIEAELTKFGLTGMGNSKHSIRAVAELYKMFPTGDNPTQAEIDKGIAILRWVLRAGAALYSKAERATDTYNKATLKAFTWIRLNARSVPDAGAIGAIVGESNNRFITQVIDDRGGEGGTLSALQLADWINRQAGRRKRVIDLDDLYWADLAKHRAEALYLTTGSSKLVQAV